MTGVNTAHKFAPSETSLHVQFCPPARNPARKWSVLVQILQSWSRKWLLGALLSSRQGGQEHQQRPVSAAVGSCSLRGKQSVSQSQETIWQVMKNQMPRVGECLTSPAATTHLGKASGTGSCPKTWSKQKVLALRHVPASKYFSDASTSVSVCRTTLPTSSAHPQGPPQGGSTLAPWQPS